MTTQSAVGYKIFYVMETTHLNATRKAEKISACSLTYAKILATKNQAFVNTALKIYDQNINLLAYKDFGEKKWTNNEKISKKDNNYDSPYQQHRDQLSF